MSAVDIKGYVQAVGGGVVEIIVDRDTMEYPPIGERVAITGAVTDIPNIALPDKFEPTHQTALGRELQLVAIVGDYFITWTGAHVEQWRDGDLTPLPPPLPKAREGWYVLSKHGHVAARGGSYPLMLAWGEVDDSMTAWVAVVKLTADGFVHVDRDGKPGVPVEIEGT